MGKQRTIAMTDPRLVVVVHHSAANDVYTDVEDLKAERLHRNEGYNFILDDEGPGADGEVRAEQDAPDTEVSNGVYGVNWRAWNVCVDGNFETARPTEDEFNGLVQVIATKTRRWGWKKADALGTPAKPSRILSHNQAGRFYSPTPYVTACPGKHLIARMDELRQRVAAYLPA